MRLKVAAAVAAALCAVSLPVCAALGNTIIAKYMKDKEANPRLDLDAIPYVKADDDQQLHHRCDFTGCPDEAPNVYMFTSHRNRAASYSRWIRSLVVDLTSEATLPPHFKPQCVCACVADYTDHAWGPTVDAALDEWPWSKHIVNLKDPFSRTGGFQVLLDEAIVTPASNSLFFLVDADMVAYPGFMHQLTNYTRVKERAFAPVVWSQDRPEKEMSPSQPDTGVDDWKGSWRMHGTGMIAFYVSDFLEVVGPRFPMVGRATYGGEDAVLEYVVSSNNTSKYKIWRRCAPDLWHLWHRKYSWGWTQNGMSREKHWGPNPWRRNATAPWVLPLPPAEWPQTLKESGNLNKLACRKAKDGFIY